MLVPTIGRAGHRVTAPKTANPPATLGKTTLPRAAEIKEIPPTRCSAITSNALPRMADTSSLSLAKETINISDLSKIGIEDLEDLPHAYLQSNNHAGTALENTDVNKHIKTQITKLMAGANEHELYKAGAILCKMVASHLQGTVAIHDNLDQIPIARLEASPLDRAMLYFDSTALLKTLANALQVGSDSMEALYILSAQLKGYHQAPDAAKQADNQLFQAAQANVCALVNRVIDNKEAVALPLTVDINPAPNQNDRHDVIFILSPAKRYSDKVDISIANSGFFQEQQATPGKLVTSFEGIGQGDAKQLMSNAVIGSLAEDFSPGYHTEYYASDQRPTIARLYEAAAEYSAKKCASSDNILAPTSGRQQPLQTGGDCPFASIEALLSILPPVQFHSIMARLENIGYRMACNSEHNENINVMVNCQTRAMTTAERLQQKVNNSMIALERSVQHASELKHPPAASS